MLSWKNLWRHRARSLAIIFSVVLGTWAGAFILSIYYGMAEGRVNIAIEQEVSHLQAHHPNFRDEFEAKWYFTEGRMDSLLPKMPGLKSYSLRSQAQGMLANASGSNGVQINGVDPEREDATRGFKAMVKTGDYFDPAKRNQVLVGKKLAEKMKLAPGAKVVLTFQDSKQEIVSGAFRVVGLYESPNAPLDERNVYLRRVDLNALLGTPGGVMEAAVLLSGEEQVAESLAWWKANCPDLQIEDWRSISPEVALVMSSIDVSSMIILVIILIALAFGIVNTMLMAVLERRREIGMLMAIGMNRLRIFGMIVFETLLLALVGCPVGLAIAWITVEWLGKTGINLSNIAGNVMKDFGFAAVIYPVLPLGKIAQIILLTAGTALLASIFPAWKALRLRPAEAIR
ncbi:MAG: ABC transporter permease [Saprospiraceae bacterium]|nr:ABC transporter permease [Saprospiraceae bacterium]